MNEAERETMMRLAEAWNSFLNISVMGDDRADFRRAIHAAQNIVLANATVRREALYNLDGQDGKVR